MRFLVTMVLVLAASMPTFAGSLQDDLLQRERKFWQAWGDRDGDTFRKELAEDYVQVVAGVGMVSGREAVASAVEKHDCEMSIFGFRDAQLRQPTPKVAILTYVATQETTCAGKALPSRVFATAVYVRQGGTWTPTMYQETPLD